MGPGSKWAVEKGRAGAGQLRGVRMRKQRRAETGKGKY